MSISILSTKLNLHMNAMNFHAYIKQEYNDDVARFVCKELLFLVPVTFAALNNIQELKTYIDHRYDKVTEESTSMFYFINSHNKMEILPTSIVMIDKIRRDVISLLNKKQKKTNCDCTTTSDSSDVRLVLSNKRKAVDDNHASYKLPTRKYRKGSEGGRNFSLLVNCCSRSDRNYSYLLKINTKKVPVDEWSFSSDDDYYIPTSGEISTPLSSSAACLNYDLYTIGRLDYFCHKYLKLKSPIEIRQLQHKAELELSLHKENLYQFFRYIRNNDKYLKKIEECAEDGLLKDDPEEKIRKLIQQLKMIKKMSDFTPYLFVSK